MPKITNITVSYNGDNRYLVSAEQPTRNLHFWFTPGKFVGTIYSHPVGRIRNPGQLSRDKPTLRLDPHGSKATAKLLGDIMLEVTDEVLANARTAWQTKQDAEARKSDAAREAQVLKMLRTDGAFLIEALRLAVELLEQQHAAGAAQIVPASIRAALAKVGA